MQSCQSLSSLLGAFLEALRSSLMASKPCRGSKERSSTAAPSPVQNKSWVLVWSWFWECLTFQPSASSTSALSLWLSLMEERMTWCTRPWGLSCAPFPPPTLQCPVALCPSFCSADLLFPAPPDVAKSGCCSKACQRARAFSYVSTMFRNKYTSGSVLAEASKALLPNPVHF